MSMKMDFNLFPKNKNTQRKKYINWEMEIPIWSYKKMEFNSDLYVKDASKPRGKKTRKNRRIRRYKKQRGGYTYKNVTAKGSRSEKRRSKHNR